MFLFFFFFSFCIIVPTVVCDDFAILIRQNNKVNRNSYFYFVRCWIVKLRFGCVNETIQFFVFCFFFLSVSFLFLNSIRSLLMLDLGFWSSRAYWKTDDVCTRVCVGQKNNTNWKIEREKKKSTDRHIVNDFSIIQLSIILWLVASWFIAHKMTSFCFRFVFFFFFSFVCSVYLINSLSSLFSHCYSIRIYWKIYFLI